MVMGPGAPGGGAPDWGLFELEVDPRTRVRALLMSDAEELFALTDANRGDLRTWLNWVDTNTRVEDTRAFISRSAREHQAGEGIHTGIWCDGVLAMMRHAFETMGLNRVEIRVVIGNRNSSAIPERLGLRQEGVLREAYWLYDGYRDVAVYSMLAREWRERPR